MNSKGSIELATILIITILGTYFFSYVAFIVIQNKYPSSLLEVWNRWDTAHYLDIAERGYSSTTIGERHLRIVFLPFYPLLIRLFSFIFKNYMLSALIVSNLAYSFAAYYLYKLVLLDYPKKNAIRAVIYISIFPTSYFLHAAYTESTFLALTIGSLYYARKERWFLSSLLGMFATTTRINGIVMVPTLLIEYSLQKGFKIRNIKKDILWQALVPLGLVLYLIINYVTFGDPLKFLHFQKIHWGESLVTPLRGFLGAWGSVLWREPADSFLLGWAQIATGILGFLSVIYSIVYLRISYRLYLFLTWLIITSVSFWLSLPRFTLTMFPMFIALSLLGKHKVINYLIIFISIFFFGLFLTLFVNGRWAF